MKIVKIVTSPFFIYSILKSENNSDFFFSEKSMELWFNSIKTLVKNIIRQ